MNLKHRVKRAGVKSYLKLHTKERMATFSQERQIDHPIVFLGDSITEGIPESLLGHDELNRGINADNTGGVLKRLHEVIALDPKAVFLLIGTNDLGNMYLQPADVVKGIMKIVSKLSGPVFVISILPVRQSQLIDQTNEQIDWINAQLAIRLKGADKEFININSNFKDDTHQLAQCYTTDGLHLSPLGYDLLMEQLSPWRDL